VNPNNKEVIASQALRTQDLLKTFLISTGNLDLRKDNVLIGNWSAEACTYGIGTKQLKIGYL